MYQQELDLARARRFAEQYPAHCFYQGSGRGLGVALTFSDGPAATTAALLDMLRVHRIPATFFWQGDQLARNHQLLRQALADGHTIGNLSWDHPHAESLSVMDFWLQQIQRTDDEFQRLAGIRPRLFRPPYAELTPEQLRILVEHDFRIMGWSIDPRNWENPTAPERAIEVTEQVLRQAYPQSIVLLHEGPVTLDNVVEVVDQIVPGLKSRGYHFVTADQLVGVKPYA